MTITIFVEPSCLKTFMYVNHILSGLNIENDFDFQPKDISFSEGMISNWNWVNLDAIEYNKFIYCYNKLKNKTR